MQLATLNICLKDRQYPINISEQVKRSTQLIPDGESFVYFSDFHSNISRLPAITGLIKKIEELLPGEKLLKFCTGDFIFGEHPLNTGVIINTLNRIGLSAIIPGNHEFDCKPQILKKIFSRLKVPVLLTNQTPEAQYFKALDHLVCSNHHSSYGIISITTPHGSLKPNPFVQGFEKSLPILQQQINQLEQQGIHKIILLSHQGLEQDKKTAHSLKGVDIIISSHDHYAIDGIKDGFNLVKSANGEPVIILQAAKDNEFTGYARVKFNQNGILEKIFNKTLPITSEGFSEDKITNYEIQKNKHNKVICNLNHDLPTDNINILECEAGNFFADNIHAALPSAEILLLPSRMIRSSLSRGVIKTIDIDEALPDRRNKSEDAFKIVKMPGQKIIDLINRINVLKESPCGKSLTHVSGMKYKLDKDYKVFRATTGNKQNINPLFPTREYTVALPGFLFVNNKFEDLGLNNLIIIDNTGKTASELLKESLIKRTTPLASGIDGRIQMHKPVSIPYHDLKFAHFLDLTT